MHALTVWRRVCIHFHLNRMQHELSSESEYESEFEAESDTFRGEGRKKQTNREKKTKIGKRNQQINVTGDSSNCLLNQSSREHYDAVNASI